MKGFMRKLLAVAIIGVVVATGLAALTGSEIAVSGSRIDLEGRLSLKDGEWFLESGGKTYELHLGNYEAAYPGGIALREGATARVSGFAEGLDVAVMTISSEGRAYELRDETGRPAWAGMGRGRNARAYGGRGY
jgi:hypothetical protein